MKILYLFLIAFALAGCSSELSENQKSQVKKEVDEAVMKFLDAKTLSFETHTGLRADKAGFLFAGDGKIEFTDYKSYREATKKIFEGVKQFTDMKILSMHTYVLAENAAVSTVEFASHFITTKGDTLPNNGCWTFVFEKFDGNWKVVQEKGTHIR